MSTKEELAQIQDDLLYFLHEFGDFDNPIALGNPEARKTVTESLRAIDMHIRRDNPSTMASTRMLGEWKAIKTHLVPLFNQAQDYQDIVLRCVKLFTRLTKPLGELVNENDELQHLQNLQRAKSALLSGDTIKILVTWMESPFETHPSQWSEEQEDLLELFLTLFRNILAIKDPDAVTATKDTELRLHDACILKFHEDGVLDVLVMMCHCLDAPKDGEKGSRRSKKDKYQPRPGIVYLLLDCLYHLFRLEQPEDLFLVKSAFASSASVQLAAKHSARNKNKAAQNGAANKTALSASLDDPLARRTEKQAASERLAEVLAKEKARKRAMNKGMSSRHSRFGTMISVQNPLQGGRTHFQRTPFETDSALPSDLYATSAGRKPMPNRPKRTYSSDRVRTALLDTCNSLLEMGYNSFMDAVTTELYTVTDFSGISADAINFMWLSAFVMGVNRLRFKSKFRQREKMRRHAKKASPDQPLHALPTVEFDATPVKSTMSMEAFGYVTGKMAYCFDTRPIDYGSLAPALEFYKEVIRAVYEMSNYGDDRNKRTAAVLKQSIFFDQDKLDILPKILKSYEDYRNNRRYLASAVVASHYAMKLLKEGTHIVVSKRRVKIKKKKEKKAKKDKKKSAKEGEEGEEGKEAEGVKEVEMGEEHAGEAGGMPEEADGMSEEHKAAAHAAAALLQTLPDKTMGVDAVGEAKDRGLAEGEEGEEGGGEGKKLVSAAAEGGAAGEADTQVLGENDAMDADSIAAAARAAAALLNGFPAKTVGEQGEEEDKGHEAEGTKDKEKKETGEEDEDEIVDLTKTKKVEAGEEEGEEGAIVFENEEDYDEYVNEQKEANWRRSEALFNFNKHVLGYAHSQVLKNYCALLSNYRDNTAETNACILKFFQRLAFDRKLVPMFWQLSIFCLFDKILSDSAIKTDANFSELRSFCKKVTREFMDKAKENPTLFVEILFWKNLMEADSMYNEESLYSTGERGRNVQMAFGKIDRRFYNGGGTAEADFDSDEAGMEFDDVANLKSAGNVDGLYGLDGAGAVRGGRWTKKEDQILIENFDDFRDMLDCTEILASMLRGRKPTAVLNRLKKLGLVRTRGKRGAGKSGVAASGGRGEAYDSDDDYSDDGPAAAGAGRRGFRRHPMLEEQTASTRTNLAKFMRQCTKAFPEFDQRPFLTCLLRKLSQMQDIRGEYESKEGEDGEVGAENGKEQVSSLATSKQLSVALSIVPMTEDEWEAFGAREGDKEAEAMAGAGGYFVQGLMRVLAFAEPEKESGCSFWRVPLVYDAKALEKASLLLEEAAAAAPDMPDLSEPALAVDNEEMKESEFRDLHPRYEEWVPGKDLEGLLAQNKKKKKNNKQQQKRKGGGDKSGAKKRRIHRMKKQAGSSDEEEYSFSNNVSFDATPSPAHAKAATMTPSPSLATPTGEEAEEEELVLLEDSSDEEDEAGSAAAESAVRRKRVKRIVDWSDEEEAAAVDDGATAAGDIITSEAAILVAA